PGGAGEDACADGADVLDNGFLPSFSFRRRALGVHEPYLHRDGESFFFSSSKTAIQRHALCSFPASLRFEQELHQGWKPRTRSVAGWSGVDFWCSWLSFATCSPFRESR